MSDRNSDSPEVRNFTEHAMCDHDIDERKISTPMNPGYSSGKVLLPIHLMQLSNITHVIGIMINKTNSQSIADGLYLMVSFLLSSSLLILCKM